jgi:hypothetical protein
MERRLRNPISQVPSFKEPHVSQQKNFLDQMRHGINMGKPFARPQHTQTTTQRTRSMITDDLDDGAELSPAASRTRGNLELRASDWHLPADTANQATGLEDLFSGSFTISESPGFPPGMLNAEGDVKWSKVVGVAIVSVLAGCAVAVTSVESVRRPVCLGIVKVMEWLGA